MEWFWYFTIYSILGCGLEIVFARAVGARPDRKRLFLLPLCPVYGVGACLCLCVAPLLRENPPALFLAGGIVCTAVEYLMAVWYERGLGVTFWDYRGQRGTLWGRVCVPFSAAWGILALCVVYGIHPYVSRAVRALPLPLSLTAALFVCADMVASGVMLRRTHDRGCLRWYARFFSARNPPARSG